MVAAPTQLNADTGNDNSNIDIDDQMRTNVPNIYAIGDVATDYRLAHIASAMGIVAAETIAGRSLPGLPASILARTCKARFRFRAAGGTNSTRSAVGATNAGS